MKLYAKKRILACYYHDDENNACNGRKIDNFSPSTTTPPVCSSPKEKEINTATSTVH